VRISPYLARRQLTSTTTYFLSISLLSAYSTTVQLRRLVCLTTFLPSRPFLFHHQTMGLAPLPILYTAFRICSKYSTCFIYIPSSGAFCSQNLLIRSIHTTVPFSATTANILRALQNETLFWGPKLFALDPTAVVIYSPEPFLPTILSHGPPSAYPPSRRVAFLPSSIEFDWSLPTVSRFAKTGIVATTLALYKAAAKDGQNIEGATPYGNYANTYTPDVAIFGPSLLRMCAVKRRVDPGNTMGQTGGWKVC
jgi:hypothetical protein